MGAVIDLVSETRVDEAWDAYVEFAHALSADPSKLTDRSFHEEFARRYENWRRLFLRQEGG